MKILFVVEHFYPHIGGAEKSLEDLALGLIKSGHKVRVLTSNSGGITGKHQHKGIEIYSYEWKSFFGHPVPSMKDLFEHGEWPDIIQTAPYTAAPRALKLSKKTHTPIAMLSYEYLGKKWYWVEITLKALAFKVFESYVYHKPYSAYIAISKATKRDLISAGIENQKITVIYPVFNNFDEWMPEITSKSKKNKVKEFIYYGRPGKTKGVDILVDAIGLIKEELGSKAVFTLILSDDPMPNRVAIIEKIKKLNIGRMVRVRNSLPFKDLKQSIADSYSVIVPSVTEGFGFSAYQACLMKKNIIASDAGSLPEVVFGNALVFKNRDAQDLSENILKAVEGDFSNYQKKIKNNQLEKIINLYNKLIN